MIYFITQQRTIEKDASFVRRSITTNAGNYNMFGAPFSYMHKLSAHDSININCKFLLKRIMGLFRVFHFETKVC